MECRNGLPLRNRPWHRIPLNVHESPNGFRWKHNPGKNDLAVIEEGMVTSDEPGVYIEGEVRYKN